MITNNDRYTVAQKLRSSLPYCAAKDAIDGALKTYLSIADAIFEGDIDDKYAIDVLDQLADLIEPETNSTCNLIFNFETQWFTCSNCGIHLAKNEFDTLKSPTEYDIKYLAYCPNCGARVKHAWK